MQILNIIYIDKQILNTIVLSRSFGFRKLGRPLSRLRIYQQQILQRSPAKGVFWVWHWTASSAKAPVLPLWEVWRYPFFAITPRSTLTRSGSPCLCPIYGLNRSVGKLFILDRNDWYHITVQTNYHHQIELLMLYRNTWNHLNVCKLFVVSYLKLIKVYY